MFRISQLFYVLIVFVAISCGKEEGDNAGGNNTSHSEDLSYLRVKSSEYESYSNGYSDIQKTITQYDGNKPISVTVYSNGKLTRKSEYSYNGLSCTGTTYTYDISTGKQTSTTEETYVYLDDTFLRVKSYENSNYRAITQYEGKKPISVTAYSNGKLSQKVEYSYNGLSCTGTTYTYDISTGKQTFTMEGTYVYLDDTFLRVKSYETVTHSNGYSSTYRAITQYEGKKPISYTTYSNGKLFQQEDYTYNGLTRTGVGYTYDVNTGKQLYKVISKTVYQ